jgi:hypothetical protein
MDIRGWAKDGGSPFGSGPPADVATATLGGGPEEEEQNAGWTVIAHVLEARNVPALGPRSGEPSTYVTLRCGPSASQKTEVCKGTAAPVWDGAHFRFDRGLTLTTDLVLEMFRDGGPDGRAAAGDGAMVGEVRLRVADICRMDAVGETRWFDVGSCPKPSQPARGVCVVHVLRARGLPSMDMNGLADPYVKLCIGKTKHTSTVEKTTLAPVWKGQHFKFENVTTDSVLRLEMFDEDRIGKDDPMGQVSIRVSEMTGSETWCELQPVEGVGTVTGEIQLCCTAMLSETEDAEQSTPVQLRLCCSAHAHTAAAPHAPVPEPVEDGHGQPQQPPSSPAAASDWLRRLAAGGGGGSSVDVDGGSQQLSSSMSYGGDDAAVVARTIAARAIALRQELGLGDEGTPPTVAAWDVETVARWVCTLPIDGNEAIAQRVREEEVDGDTLLQFKNGIEVKSQPTVEAAAKPAH